MSSHNCRAGMRWRPGILLSLVAAWILVWGGQGIIPPAHAAPAISTTLVISELRTRGPVGANDEFVELFNLSPDAIDISGWKIAGSNASGGTSTRLTLAAGTILPGGCRFLATNGSSTGYSGSIPGDQSYAVGFTDDGGVALLQPDNTIVDAVGMSLGSSYREGTPLTPLSGTANQSYERLPNDGLANAYNRTDTDDNAADFGHNAATSNPQNLTSSCTPLGVTLSDFRATAATGHVLVGWETTSEVGNTGFHLWRGTSPNAPSVQLNSALIPSQAPGSTQGFVYEWIDDFELVNATTYYYWLDDVNTAGVSTRHGPVSTVYNTPSVVHLGNLAAVPVQPVPWAAVAGAGLAASCAWLWVRRR